MHRSAALVSTLLLATLGAQATFAVPAPRQESTATAPAVSALDAALALVPKGAVAFVVLPNPKQASDDLQQCVERMNRAEASLGGRPIDQLKALYGISGSFDDKGPAALSVMAYPSPGAAPPIVLSLPSIDPAAFLSGNFTKAPEVAEDAYRTAAGLLIHARAGEKHVHLSLDRDTLHAFEPGGGIAESVRTRLGDRGAALLKKGDLIAWAGRDAIQPALRQAALDGGRAVQSDSPFAAQATEMRATLMRLFEGLDDTLLVLDMDPLGLGIRTFASCARESEIGSLATGGADREPRFDRVPRQPFYLAGRVDIDGMGGMKALESLVAKLPGAPQLPAWLVKAKDAISAMQMGIFPSKLALAAGGVLNDSAIFLETKQPEVVRDGVREAILSMKGESGGLRVDPAWEADRALKSGETVDAFEVTETVVSTKEANPADLSMRRILTQAIYGSRGLVGFVKRHADGVTMTFSQRTDVLERAMKTASGGTSLQNDPVIAAYREWLIDRPDVGRADLEVYVGVGQFGKLFKQVMTMIPGGDQMRAPEIPVSTEPIAFALELDKGTIETATVLPSGVLGLMWSAGVQTQMGSRPQSGGDASQKAKQ